MRRAEVEVRRFQVSELIEAEYNARKITKDAARALRRSMEEFGLLAHPVVNLADGSPRLVGGHQRVRLLADMGEQEVDCLVTHLTPEQEKAANFALNNPAIQGRYIPELVYEVLAEIEDLSPDNYADWNQTLRFDRLDDGTEHLRFDLTDIGTSKVTGGHCADDSIPKVPTTRKPDSKPGTVYRLGEHRIYCLPVGALPTGDTWRSLAGDDQASLAVSWLGDQALRQADNLDAWLGEVISATFGPFYLAVSFDDLAACLEALDQTSGVVDSIITAHLTANNPRKSVPYTPNGLAVVYGGESRKPRFYGAENSSNLWSIPGVLRVGDMPVSVAVRAILDGSQANDVVMDVWCHQGATVVAAEKTGRRLFGYAPSPQACDTVRARWTSFALGDSHDWRSETTPLKLTRGQA